MDRPALWSENLKRRKQTWDRDRLDAPRDLREKLSPKGTCYADCMAMLDIPGTNHAELVKRFYKHKHKKFHDFRQVFAYLKKRGYIFQTFHLFEGKRWRDVDTFGHQYTIAVGKSGRNQKTLHAMIARRNRIVFDPNGQYRPFVDLESVNRVAKVQRKGSRDHDGLRRRG